MTAPLSRKEFVALNWKFLLLMTPFWLIIVMAIYSDDIVKIVDPLFLVPALIALTIVQLLLLVVCARKSDKDDEVKR